MPTPPSFVAEYETAWSTGASPKTASVTVSVGDVLVVAAAAASWSSSSDNLNTPTGGGLTYTLEQSYSVINDTSAWIWTALSDSSQTFTLSVAENGGAQLYGFNALRFSGSDGIGNSTIVHSVGSGVASTTPLTSIQDNSAVVLIGADWNAVDFTTRTWATVNGVTPTSGNGLERTYFRDSAQYTVYAAYWDDVGVAGGNTYGITTTGVIDSTIAAVEVKGAAPVAPWTYGYEVVIG